MTSFQCFAMSALISGVWIRSSEPDEAEREIAQLARQQKWKLAAWDISNGLRLLGGGEAR